ncbi:MAG: zinc-binding alcohol dehydrogenase family protein [Limnochordia bacterium]
MKAIVLVEPGQFRIEERPVPEAGPGEALIKVRAAGICGSDLHGYRGSQPFMTFPRVMGHEFSGEIAAFGPGYEGPFKVGDAVVVDPVVNCGHCYACRTGNHNVCRTVEVLGVHRDGAFTEYLAVRTDRIHRMPEGMDFVTAALVEPLSIGAEANRRAATRDGDRVAIIGAGPIGLVSLLIAKTMDTQVIITDMVPSRLELAKQLGADRVVNVAEEDPVEAVMEFTDNEGASAVIEAVGLEATIRQSIEMVAPSGRIAMLGLSKGDLKLPASELIKKGVDFHGSRLNCNQFPVVLELLEQGKFDPTPLISKEYHFTEMEKAMEDFDKHPDQVTKVILTFD